MCKSEELNLINNKKKELKTLIELQKHKIFAYIYKF